MALGLLIINFLCFGVLFDLRKKVTIKLVVWGLITLSVVSLEIFGLFSYKKYQEVCFSHQDHLFEVPIRRKQTQLRRSYINYLLLDVDRFLGTRRPVPVVHGLLLQRDQPGNRYHGCSSQGHRQILRDQERSCGQWSDHIGNLHAFDLGFGRSSQYRRSSEDQRKE